MNMDTFGSPIPIFEYIKTDFEENKTDVKLVEVKTEDIEIKEENCDAYSTEDVESSNTEANILIQNIKADTDFDVKIEDIKKSGVICAECKKEYSSVRKLKMHFREVHKEHKCSLCDFVTHSTFKLKKHVLNVHNAGSVYECPNCDYKTPSKPLLKQHLNSKTPCQIRRALPKTLNGVNIPQQICTKEENGFKCVYCKFNATFKWAVKKHFYAVHLRLKNHSCLHCEFASTDKQSLELHMLRKHAEKCVQSHLKQKVCHTCGKKFFFSSSLNKHMQSAHLKEKQKCSLCNYACNSNIGLLYHIRRVHETEKLFKCHDCGYTSPAKYQLKEHILKKHLNTVHQ